MNILPFVFAILILMALTGGYLSQDVRSIAEEKKVIEGYLAADRKLRSLHEHDAYDKVATPESKDKKEKKEKSNSNNKQFKTHRDERNYSEGSKFVLTPEERLRAPALRLLQLLYKKASFYKKGLEADILDAILSTEGKTFADRFPKNPALAQAYYQMLQGTNVYDIATGQGYPPLTDFFVLGKENDKIDFKQAHRYVLISILGVELTEKIIGAEKKLWEEDRKTKRLSKGRLEDLVKKDKGFDLNQIDTYFSFGKSKRKNNTVAVDTSSGITARKRHNGASAGEGE